MITNPEVLAAMFSEEERKAFAETVMELLCKTVAIKRPHLKPLLSYLKRIKP